VTGASLGLLGVVIAMVGVAIGLLIKVTKRLDQIEAYLKETG